MGIVINVPERGGGSGSDFKLLAKSNIEIVGMGATGPMQGSALTQAATWQQILAVKARAFSARVTYYNLSASSYTVDKTTITPSSTYVGGGVNFDPTGGASPVNVTFSGGAAAIVPAGSTALPSLIQSDWVAVSPLDRTDVTEAFYLWHLRSYLQNPTAYPFQQINNYATYPGNSISGRVWMTSHKIGDLIATPAGYDTNTGIALGVNVEFRGLRRNIKVLSIGDSITAGVYPTSLAGSFSNIIDQAVEMINVAPFDAEILYSHINGGVSSQSFAQFYGRLPALLAAHSPDIVVMPTWTPNNGAESTAQLDAMNYIMANAINTVITSGAVPILWTGMPKNGGTINLDLMRRANNNMWRNIASSKSYILCDLAALMDGVVSSGVTQFAPGMSTDGTHPNGAGQQVCAKALSTALLNV